MNLRNASPNTGKFQTYKILKRGSGGRAVRGVAGFNSGSY
jgi:hypothetical protein